MVPWARTRESFSNSNSIGLAVLHGLLHVKRANVTTGVVLRPLHGTDTVKKFRILMERSYIGLIR